MRINKDKASYITNISMDEIGRVFSYEGKIFRGINKGKEDDVRELFSSGFIDELVENGLFVESKISKYKHDDYDLLIEHKKIDPFIFPHNWTFNMLKDSALLVLRIAEICKKYDYNMKDCHYLNISIFNNKPVFVDLGSFFKDEKHGGSIRWAPYRDFLQCYLYPLKMWSAGMTSSSKILISYDNRMDHLEYFLFKNKLSRALNPKVLSKFIEYRLLLFGLLNRGNEEIKDKIDNKFVSFFAIAFKVMFQRIELFKIYGVKSLKRKINKISRPRTKSAWGDYYCRGGVHLWWQI